MSFFVTVLPVVFVGPLLFLQRKNEVSFYIYALGYVMLCPKCHEEELNPIGHFRWKCARGEECGFMCGLSFFFDDEGLATKLEVGLPIEQLELSDRASELMKTGALDLNDLERASKVDDLPSVKRAQAAEDQFEELSSLMRDVVGRSAGIHRHLTSGDSYRKIKGGGLIGKQRA